MKSIANYSGEGSEGAQLRQAEEGSEEQGMHNALIWLEQHTKQ